MFYLKDEEHLCVFLLLNHLTDLPLCICLFFQSLVCVYFTKISLQKLLIDGLHSDRISIVFFFTHYVVFSVFFTVFVTESRPRLASKLSLGSLKAMDVKRLVPIIQYFSPKFILSKLREAHYQHIWRVIGH